MSLTNSLLIGSSALSASQLGIQVTGHNLANSATPGYSRQVIGLAGARSVAGPGGLMVGTGVMVADIRRQVSESLESRLRAAVSDELSGSESRTILGQLEATLHELTGQDLSTQLSTYFTAWSERANNTGADATVVQQGVQLAGFVRGLRSDLSALRTQVDADLAASTARADALLGDIARLNAVITTSEVGRAVAGDLRDQRASLLTELAALIDISAVEQPDGSVDVLAGSIPVVLGSTSRGLTAERRTTAAGVDIRIGVRADGQEVAVAGGRIGGLLGQRNGSIDGTIARLDALAAQLVEQVNRLHATGVPSEPLTSLTGWASIAPADRALALNDPTNASLSSLPFKPVNGGFTILVRSAATGAVQPVRIEVDLDGLTDAGAAGFGDDTSLEDLRAAIDAAPGVSASITPDGRLTIEADAGHDIAFADDSSGVVAALGINSFFTGRDATDIAVDSRLVERPSLLAVGRRTGSGATDNGAALDLAALQNSALAALGGLTIGGSWRAQVESVGSAAAAATIDADAATLVRQSLDAQRAAVSGVSIDEESVNLITFQQSYQGAARFISVVNELTAELVNLV